jgi:hypothetical protein
LVVCRHFGGIDDETNFTGGRGSLEQLLGRRAIPGAYADSGIFEKPPQALFPTGTVGMAGDFVGNFGKVHRLAVEDANHHPGEIADAISVLAG